MQIFLSYRRKGDSHLSGRLRDQLGARYGADAIFFDVDSIPAGGNVRTVIRESIARSEVVLAIIGPAWNRRLRLYRRRDWVRLEIEDALALGRHVIPVLVDGTPLPRRDQLPRSLQPLLGLNALKIRADPDFKGDFRLLVDCIEQLGSAGGNSSAGPGGLPVLSDLEYGDRAAERRMRRRLGALGTVTAAGAAVVLAAVTLVPDGHRTDVLSTTVAPSSSSSSSLSSSSTANTAATTTAAASTTAAPPSLRGETDPWTIRCDGTPGVEQGTGAEAGEPVQLAYGPVGSSDLAPYMVSHADAGGRFDVSFTCSPDTDITVWSVTMVGLNSGRAGRFVVVRAGSAAATSSAPASTASAPKPGSGATVATTAASTAPPVAPTTVKVTAATTVATTATTLRPPS